MSAAAIAVSPEESPAREALPVPPYTRHMLGALEADRDRSVARGTTTTVAHAA
jgi:hypothetical protein